MVIYIVELWVGNMKNKEYMLGAKNDNKKSMK